MDELILRRARKGDTAAFEQLITPYEQLVWRVCWHYTHHTEDARDCAQEAMVKAWRSLPQYRQDCALETWLYRIARNTAFDHLSRHDREKTNMPTTSINDDIAELKELPATMHNPEEDIINQQEYDKWLTNIEKLKEEYRIVAKMNLIDNFGYKEIADALEMPINTVKTKIRRAKAQLLKMMDYSDELL